MSARDEAVEMIRRICPPHLDADGYGRLLAERFDAHRAEVLAVDGQAYDGQLVMLTGLVATLHAVAEHGGLDDVRKVLAEHQADDAEAREKSSPTGADAAKFFQPGRTYRSHHDAYMAPELILTFRVEHVTRHPDRGYLRAIGWMRSCEPGARWHGDFRDEHEFSGWTDVTDTATTGKDGRP